MVSAIMVEWSNGEDGGMGDGMAEWSNYEDGGMVDGMAEWRNVGMVEW
jgi:hypothetical protein